MEPVIYSVMREMLWRFGHLDDLFKHLGHDGKLDINYCKVPRMPKYKHVAQDEIEA